MCDKRQLTHPHMALNYLEPTQNLNQKNKKERERTDIASIVLSYKLVMLQISNHYTSMI